MNRERDQASSREASDTETLHSHRTDSFEWWLRNVRLLGDADDPLFFVGICLLAGGTGIGLIASLVLQHGNEIRDVTFKLAGGALVALGAYTAVRTVVSNRGNSASQTFTGLLAILADDPATAGAARIGAIMHLPDLARRRGADTTAIEAVIRELHRSNSEQVRDAAVDARSSFPEKHEQRAPDHGIRRRARETLAPPQARPKP